MPCATGRPRRGPWCGTPTTRRGCRTPTPCTQSCAAANPVHRNALGFWVFTRHADCLAILRDRRSSSDGRNVDESTFRELRAVDLPAQQGPEAMLAEMAPFLFRDPPDHTRLRGLVQKAFTPAGRGSPAAAARGDLRGAPRRGPRARARSTSWPTTPIRCPCRSSWRCWGCRPRTTSSSGCGRTPWPGASTPTSFSPRGGAAATGGHPRLRAVLRLAHRAAAPASPATTCSRV